MCCPCGSRLSNLHLAASIVPPLLHDLCVELCQKCSSKRTARQLGKVGFKHQLFFWLFIPFFAARLTGCMPAAVCAWIEHPCSINSSTTKICPLVAAKCSAVRFYPQFAIQQPNSLHRETRLVR